MARLDFAMVHYLLSRLRWATIDKECLAVNFSQRKASVTDAIDDNSIPIRLALSLRAVFKSSIMR